MSTISKVLSIFIFVSSVGFMALALALKAGGPNWMAEARAEDIQDEYAITRNEGETVTWGVTRRFGDEGNVDTTPALPRAVVKARQDLASSQTTRIQEVDAETLVVKDTIEQLRVSVEQDLAAIVARDKQLQTEAQAIEQQVAAKSDEWTRLSRETESIRSEGKKRYEDIIRLNNELHEIKTDRFRLTKLRHLLTDRLIRLKIDNRGLELRNKQLKDED